MIIDENQLSSAHNILNTTKFETTNKTTPPPKQQTKMAIVKASSYLSIGQIIILKCKRRSHLGEQENH